MTTRGQLLKQAAGASIAAMPPVLPLAPKETPLALVLVHGTWHGGWVWRDVRHRLRSLGHTVVTSTCTGCGERAHLANADVGLDTHITDITNVIRYEELNNIVLVGHSFSGLTITGVADRLQERIRRIVFFDAPRKRKDDPSAIGR